MSSSKNSATVVAELDARFGPYFSHTEILDYATCAMQDLRGSVAAEAVPEMATRLAGVRMTSAGAWPGSVWKDTTVVPVATTIGTVGPRPSEHA